MNAISLLLVSLGLSFVFPDMTYFCFPHPHHFLLTFLFSLNFSFCLTPSILLLFSTGATVLLVNATDLDASREFGQASLIYSLEGSSQFRLNSRSGVCVCVCSKRLHGVDFFLISLYSVHRTTTSAFLMLTPILKVFLVV